MNRPLILASASPRRAQLLTQIGLTFRIVRPDVDETPRHDELPEVYVRRLAAAKAAAVLALQRVPQPGQEPVVVAADTVVTLKDEILGKPEGRTDNEAMLLKLGGRAHQVITAVCVADRDTSLVESVTTEVHFRPIGRDEANRYALCGEGADKAGGYGIQGIGGIFAERIVGSYSAVVGLPLATIERLLGVYGVDTWAGRNDVR